MSEKTAKQQAAAKLREAANILLGAGYKVGQSDEEDSLRAIIRLAAELD